MREIQESVFGSVQSEPYKRMEALISAIKNETQNFRRSELEEAVRGLSRDLSERRGKTVSQAYLESELAQAAYCTHFLPWNIYRLAMAWKMSPPQKLRDKATVVDWGTGPLTTLFALWVLGFIDEKKHSYHAHEKQAGILESGLRIKETLGIKVKLKSSTRPLRFDDENPTPNADLLIVSQSLNEWLPARGRETTNIEAFARKAQQSMHANGELFVLEPASRVASWGVMELRKSLLDKTTIIGPCTHTERCPLLSSTLKNWCHFREELVVHPAHKRLPGSTHLEREHLSYSYLHTLFEQESSTDTSPKFGKARIIGSCIKVQGGHGAYACAPEGRILLTSKKPWSQAMKSNFAPGCVVSYPKRKLHGRDPVSGAKLVWLSDCRADASGPVQNEQN